MPSAPIARERRKHAAADPTADARSVLPAELPAGCRQRFGPCRWAPGDRSGQHHADYRAHSRPEWTACSRSAGRDLAMRREWPLSLCPGWPCRSAARREFPGVRGDDHRSDGGYQFLTIRPVPYPGRTPHIHFAVSGRGFERFITQMYVAGEPGNDGDPVLMGVRDPAARARLIVALRPSPDVGPDGLSGVFDIVLG